MTPRDRLYNAVLTLNILNANETGTRAAERHWTIEKNCWIKSACVLQGRLDISMGNGEGVTMGLRLRLCFYRNRDVVDTIKINKT